MHRIEQFNNEFAHLSKNHEFKNGTRIPIFEITSYHALIQFIGYAKYLNRKVGNVYLSGQHLIHDTLKPSIFRAVSTNGGFLKRNIYIHNFIKECAKGIPVFNELDDIVREPLLQHYGIGTRWIDLVDNVWVAIWFGSYAWHTAVFGREYKNVIPREKHRMSIFIFC